MVRLRICIYLQNVELSEFPIFTKIHGKFLSVIIYYNRSSSGGGDRVNSCLKLVIIIMYI